MGTNAAPAIQEERLVPGVAAALITAVFAVITCTSLASLIFSGAPEGLQERGTAVVLFSAVVICGYVSLASSFRGIIAIPQDRVAPILAIMLAGIAESMQGYPADLVISTLMASLPLVAAMTGLFLYVLGGVSGLVT